MNKSEIIEKTNTQVSHRHWCEVDGHEYECSADCLCICGLPMNGNDHSDCPVELRACPEHKEEQKPMSREEQREIAEQDAAPSHCQCGCPEIDLSGVVGWCLHCDHLYANYTPELENRHFANHCPGVPRDRKERCTGKTSQAQNIVFMKWAIYPEKHRELQ